MYLERELTVEQIGRVLGVSRTSIHRALQRDPAPLPVMGRDRGPGRSGLDHHTALAAGADEHQCPVPVPSIRRTPLCRRRDRWHLVLDLIAVGVGGDYVPRGRPRAPQGRVQRTHAVVLICGEAHVNSAHAPARTVAAAGDDGSGPGSASIPLSVVASSGWWSGSGEALGRLGCPGWAVGRSGQVVVGRGRRLRRRCWAG